METKCTLVVLSSIFWRTDVTSPKKVHFWWLPCFRCKGKYGLLSEASSIFTENLTRQGYSLKEKFLFQESSKERKIKQFETLKKVEKAMSFIFCFFFAPFLWWLGAQYAYNFLSIIENFLNMLHTYSSPEMYLCVALVIYYFFCLLTNLRRAGKWQEIVLFSWFILWTLKKKTWTTTMNKLTRRGKGKIVKLTF